MGRGPGVSIGELADGRCRVRWRETVIDEATGQSRSVQRERVVQDRATAITLQAKVLRAIETGEVPQVDPVRRVPAVCSLDSLFAGWLRDRAAHGVAASTLVQYGTRQARVLRVLRQRHGIADTDPVSAAVLSRDEVNAITLALRADGLADGTLNGTIGMLLQVWAWGSDDPAEYPGLAPAPRAMRPPRPPKYVPTKAPTLAECDAVIRRLAANPAVSLPVAVVARCTGLRAGQVLAALVEDFHPAECTLTVRAGKSDREKAERRTVPIVAHLRDWLLPRVAGRDPAEPLIRRRADARADRAPTRALGLVWTAAVNAGEVRPGVWDPPTRVNGRPDHAFRAALINHLDRAGVHPIVRRWLVGHALTMEERHYLDEAGPAAARAAVDTIPPIKWAAEEALPDNVRRLKR